MSQAKNSVSPFGDQWGRAAEFYSLDQLDEAVLAAEHTIPSAYQDPSELLEMLEEQESWD